MGRCPQVRVYSSDITLPLPSNDYLILRIEQKGRKEKRQKGI
jgi:hypothetical protein